MKTATILTGALASTMLLACAACTPPPADRVAVKRDFIKEGLITKKGNKFLLSAEIVNHALSIAPKEEEWIKPCSNLPTHPSASRVVKLRINNNFDVKNTTRDVISKLPAGNGVKQVPEPGPHPNPTTYDLKLDKSVWDAAGQVIAVKIILKDKEMRFLDDDHSVSTVKSDAPATSMFTCLDPINYDTEDKADSDPEDSQNSTSKDKYDSVTFYVGETNRRIQKFNIRLVVFQKKYPYVLPLIVDPEVENTGFN